MNVHSGEAWHEKGALCAIAVAGILVAIAMMMEMQTDADDVHDPRAPIREHSAPGTRFWFEVIESFNARYQGDTAGHIGRGGGLTLHPHVALGDPVYHKAGDTDKAIGSVTGVVWERLKGSLTVEFRPHDEHRIAVGDEVWVDLNPTFPNPPAPTAATPISETAR